MTFALSVMAGVGLVAYFALLGACVHAALSPPEPEDSAATAVQPWCGGRSADKPSAACMKQLDSRRRGGEP